MCSKKVLDTIFDEFDADGDGAVSEKDLQTHIRKLFPKEARIVDLTGARRPEIAEFDE